MRMKTVITRGKQKEFFTETLWDIDDCEIDLESCMWPIEEDIWEGRGGPNSQLHFSVKIYPASWDE